MGWEKQMALTCEQMPPVCVEECPSYMGNWFDVVPLLL